MSQSPNTTIAIRRPVKERMTETADQYRLSIVEFAEVLLNGWELLTPEQRRQAIERQPSPTPTPQ